jgi:amino acid adenylation domain-containing protein
LTYRQLNSRANQLAHHLINAGVVPDQIVGISVERDVEMLVGLLGILKSGGAYLPLDPCFPRSRLEYMARDAGMTVLVTQNQIAAELPFTGTAVICLDRDREAIAANPETTPVPRSGPQNLAYVLYTSGSTGRPKGVPIDRGSLANLLLSTAQIIGYGPQHCLLAVSTLSFDIATGEMLLPLITGARLVIADSEEVLDGARLARRLAECGANVFQATPATFRMMIDAGWQGDLCLRIQSTGEAIDRELARWMLEHCGELWNLYGPTETTIWSTEEKLETADPVTIGRPIANTQIYILVHRRRGIVAWLPQPA